MTGGTSVTCGSVVSVITGLTMKQRSWHASPSIWASQSFHLGMSVPPFEHVSPSICTSQSFHMHKSVLPYAQVSPSICTSQSFHMGMSVLPYAQVSPSIWACQSFQSWLSAHACMQSACVSPVSSCGLRIANKIVHTFLLLVLKPTATTSEGCCLPWV